MIYSYIKQISLKLHHYHSDTGGTTFQTPKQPIENLLKAKVRNCIIKKKKSSLKEASG